MLDEKETQIKIGNATEKFIAKTLKNDGYWVYNMPLKINGQPCDLFAAKGKKNGSYSVWLIDAKHVSAEDVSFTFNRVEPNQITAFAYAMNYAKLNNLGFCIFFERDKKLYWFSYQDFIKYSQLGCKSVNMRDLREFSEVLNSENDNQQ